MRSVRRFGDVMSEGPRITFVLPCFNEGARVASTLAALDAWFDSGVELLIVDDASADDTADHAERYARDRPHVRVHRLARNRGKGGALRSAIPLVRTDGVVFMDADLAFDRVSIQRVVDGLASADIVIANRRHDQSYYAVPVRLFGFLYRRHLVGLLFNLFVRLLTRVEQPDTQCGLKAFRRAILEAMGPSLHTDGFALDVEILVVANALGAKVAAVPVNVRYETAKSSVALATSGWAMASDVLRIGLRRAVGVYTPARVSARARARAEIEHQV